jgi:hypothetical protein
LGSLPLWGRERGPLTTTKEDFLNNLFIEDFYRTDYRYLIFIQSRIRTSPKVTIFAAMMGVEFIQIPYEVQRSIPAAKSRSMTSEKSLVSLSFQVRITCGTKEIVVRAPAI